MTFKLNPILWADSYKQSHFRQYPPDVKYVTSYIEARDGDGLWDVVFFGLQPYLMDHLSAVPDLVDIAEAAEICEAHGVPFNREGWEKLHYLGYWPVAIEALPEGTVVGRGVPLVQITNTHPDFAWLPSYLETSLLASIWYPTTVASVSYEVRQIISEFLTLTSDDPEGNIGFGLNDFGVRGATSEGSAVLGGMAHLVNFIGTDNLPAIAGARHYYKEEMAGFSVPATEHSTMTSWGEARELDAIKNMLDTFPDGIVSVVLDSYDLDRAIEEYIGVELRDKIIARGDRGGRFVVRPDSGEPRVIVLRTIRQLENIFGATVNERGYKVLPPFIRIIQGDGVNADSIYEILSDLEREGYAAENVIFGMGGALLQNVTRDTLRFAQKANAVVREMEDGTQVTEGVHKAPKTDLTKSSKKGIQGVYRDHEGKLIAARIDDRGHNGNALEIVYLNSSLKKTTFAEVRERALQGKYVK